MNKAPKDPSGGGGRSIGTKAVSRITWIPTLCVLTAMAVAGLVLTMAGLAAPKSLDSQSVKAGAAVPKAGDPRPVAAGPIAAEAPVLRAVETGSARQSEDKQQALTAGQEGRGPWWMRQTALEPGGRFPSLKTRRWWKKALALKPGENFTPDVGGEAKDRMLVRRETVAIAGRDVDTLIWIIDDDGDGSAPSGGDRDSDCYVIDYGVDGLVDRMIDYIDDNGDGQPDETEIRFFDDGALNYAWFGVVMRGAGPLWDLRDFGKSLDGLRASDPSGDKLFYVNKYYPGGGRWVPLGECPLAFYSSAGDAPGRASVRLAVVPEDWNPAREPDFATAGFAAPWRSDMRPAAVAGLCASFALEAEEGVDARHDLGLSLDLTGSRPYDFPGMSRFNVLRRPPQETVVIPWDRAAALVDGYESSQAGFSWVETGETPDPGVPSAGDLNEKGVAWIRERRFMPNSGGPAQKWNVRREWSGKASAKREFYYSDVDKRIHLFGADEGWLQIGHFAGFGVLGEIRMFDTDGNGFFDRWEFYLANGTRPVRATQVKDEKVRRLETGLSGLPAFYAKDVLPKAKAENDRLLAAMSKLRPFDPPAGLRGAMASGAAGERLYAQDICRELAYISLRDYYATLANQILLKDGRAPGEFKATTPERSPERKQAADAVSEAARAWTLARILERLDLAYGEGDYAKACDTLDELGKAAAGR